MKKLFYLLVATITITVSSCRKFDFKNYYNHHQNEKSDANVAIDWYKLQLSILLERNSALNGVYFGYIGIGLYESVRNGTPGGVSLSDRLYHMPEMPFIENNKIYNWQVSANAAMANMVRSFYTGLTPANNASIDSLEKVYNDRLSLSTPAEVFNRSQSYGKSIATAIYNWYSTDDFNPSNIGYVPPVFPGAWVPTPPAFVNPINPYVGKATTYLQSDLTGLAPAPTPYSEDPSSDFYKMVKNVYDVSQTLTTDQK
ncbi:MAG TPA: hypothetical protein VIJ92_18460, partial [Ginsengibacter sp.]